MTLEVTLLLVEKEILFVKVSNNMHNSLIAATLSFG